MCIYIYIYVFIYLFIHVVTAGALTAPKCVKSYAGLCRAARVYAGSAGMCWDVGSRSLSRAVRVYEESM